jgi:hypothetical protein
MTSDVAKRVTKHPRGYLRDSGLLHALLRVPTLDALLSHPQVGASWEGMVIEEVLRQLHALGAAFDYSYYRTNGGAEVDLVLDGAFGRVAFEIKRTSAVGSRDLRSISSFVNEHGARCGIVVTNDAVPRRLAEQIVAVPMSHL